LLLTAGCCLTAHCWLLPCCSLLAAALLTPQGRVQAVCQQLQSDISRMKSARAAVQRRMEAREREFREWRLGREREMLALRRSAQRQSAALQQHQAMHSKQQVRAAGSPLWVLLLLMLMLRTCWVMLCECLVMLRACLVMLLAGWLTNIHTHPASQAVLKRKTEEAEAARRKLRDLLELQTRVRRDRRGRTSGGGPDDRGALMVTATATVLHTSACRRRMGQQRAHPVAPATSSAAPMHF
jgi:hypothetical protein